MQIVNYFQSENKTVLRSKIAACDWSAARFLVELLETERFNEMLGGWGEIYLLMDGENLVSFLTLTGLDAVRDPRLTPWIGFVYTLLICAHKTISLGESIFWAAFIEPLEKNARDLLRDTASETVINNAPSFAYIRKLYLTKQAITRMKYGEE